MKRLIILGLMVLSINAAGQMTKPITKGNMLIEGGGTIQFQRDKYISSSNTSRVSSYFISLSPGVAYFFIDNLAAGLSATIFYNGIKNNKFYTLGIGPMVRYYFNNGFFIKADAGYSLINYISSSASNEKYLSLTPGVGYAFFLNGNVSLEPAFCYEFDNIDLNISNTHKINSFRLELKLSIFL